MGGNNPGAMKLLDQMQQQINAPGGSGPGVMQQFQQLQQMLGNCMF